MSEHDTPVAEGTLNKKEGSSVVAHHESTLIYFSTENEELILLNEKIASALDDHARNLMMLVDEVHKANEIYSAAIEAYGKVLSHPDRAAELTSLEAKVSEAEQKLADKKKYIQFDVDTIEKSENITSTVTWNYAVDLDWKPKEETKPLKLTMEQIAEKFNAERIEIVNY